MLCREVCLLTTPMTQCQILPLGVCHPSPPTREAQRRSQPAPLQYGAPHLRECLGCVKHQDLAAHLRVGLAEKALSDKATRFLDISGTGASCDIRNSQGEREPLR
jgi:hypothetical protein